MVRDDAGEAQGDGDGTVQVRLATLHGTSHSRESWRFLSSGPHGPSGTWDPCRVSGLGPGFGFRCQGPKDPRFIPNMRLRNIWNGHT